MLGCGEVSVDSIRKMVMVPLPVVLMLSPSTNIYSISWSSIAVICLKYPCVIKENVLM